MLLPQPRRELCDIGGRVLADTLENVGKKVGRSEVVQPTGCVQALDDADVLGPQLGPAEHPIFQIMSSSA